MKAPPKPKPSTASPFLMKLFIGIAVLLLLVILGLYLNSSTGKAVTVTEAPVLAPVNLVEEEEMILTVLPAERRSFEIISETSRFDRAPLHYDFTLIKLNDESYSLVIKPFGEERIIAQDFLSKSVDSPSLIHLNNDGRPDLSVRISNNKLFVDNLHYISPNSAKITLTNRTFTHGLIIKLRKGEHFNATLNASSIVPPEITVRPTGPTGFRLTNEEKVEAPEEQTAGEFKEASTTYNVSWTAPAESRAQLLEINATVSGKSTHAYYTFVVGNKSYALLGEGSEIIPHMEMDLVEGGRAELRVNFTARKGLHPFALPCLLSSMVPSAVFIDSNINRIYTWNAETQSPLVWNVGSAPGEITTLALGKAYFVELKSDAKVDLMLTCEEVRSLVPISPRDVPAIGTVESINLKRGWNMISLPGITPRSLADFADVDLSALQVNRCSFGNDCPLAGASALASANVPLQPGRVYWVHSTKDITLSYVLRE